MHLHRLFAVFLLTSVSISKIPKTLRNILHEVGKKRRKTRIARNFSDFRHNSNKVVQENEIIITEMKRVW